MTVGRYAIPVLALLIATVTVFAQEKRTVADLDKACTQGDGAACYEVGLRYGKGDGVERLVARSNYFFLKACDASHGGGCFSLASAFLTGNGFERDVDKAMVLLIKACDLGEPAGCQNMGVIADRAKDYVRAAAFYERSCRGKIASGCFNLGSLYADGLGVASDSKKAQGFFEKACALGHAKGCRRAGK